jgi:hypothetical protein
MKKYKEWEHPVFNVKNENDSDLVKILKKKHLYLTGILDKPNTNKNVFMDKILLPKK